MAEFEQGFNSLDVDHDGLISGEEFKARTLAEGISFKGLDWKGDVIINWREYAICFNILDTNKDDYINKAKNKCASRAAFKML